MTRPEKVDVCATCAGSGQRVAWLDVGTRVFATCKGGCGGTGRAPQIPAGKVLAAVAILAAVAVVIWADGMAAGGLLVAVGVVAAAGQREEDAPRCALCWTTLVGNSADARERGWRFTTILPSGDPGWQCPACAETDEECPEGHPNPGAGFCGGLTKNRAVLGEGERKDQVSASVHVWTWRGPEGDLTLRRSDGLEVTTLLYVRRADGAAHREYLDDEGQARVLERAREVVASPAWPRAHEPEPAPLTRQTARPGQRGTRTALAKEEEAIAGRYWGILNTEALQPEPPALFEREDVARAELARRQALDPEDDVHLTDTWTVLPYDIEGVLWNSTDTSPPAYEASRIYRMDCEIRDLRDDLDEAQAENARLQRRLEIAGEAVTTSRAERDEARDEASAAEAKERRLEAERDEARAERDWERQRGGRLLAATRATEKRLDVETDTLAGLASGHYEAWRMAEAEAARMHPVVEAARQAVRDGFLGRALTEALEAFDRAEAQAGGSS